MNWDGSGFLHLLNYGLYVEAVAEKNAILTENDFEIMTEISQDILTES